MLMTFALQSTEYDISMYVNARKFITW